MRPFNTPDQDLQAPPEGRAIGGRMNAAEVRVFYGALQERIAVAETRPPVGSHIVVGSFTPTRRLKILDFGALGDVFQYVDIFDPQFDAVSTQLTFLRWLEQEISLPIQPNDETLDYIPTQVIAEYCHIVLGLDGVAYRSAQTTEVSSPWQLFGSTLDLSDRNIVLFGSAAVTAGESSGGSHTPGLRFNEGSAQLLDVTRIEIGYQRNMWAHYEPPVSESAAAVDNDRLGT